MGIPSCSIGHPDFIHDCQRPFRAKGVKTVVMHRIPWSCMGHVNTPHKFGPKCKSSHSRPIAKGSSTVIVGGTGAGRETDSVAACTAVEKGWPEILTGG